MKVINHHKGNFYYVDNSVMYGTIEMTREEYTKTLHFLKGEYDRAVKRVDTYRRDHLSFIKDFIGENAQPNILIGGYFCLGVCATELIFNFYSLKGYKKQNYAIKFVL